VFRDKEHYGEVIEPVHKIVVAMPRSDLEAIQKEVFRRQDRLGRAAASRDSLIRECVRAYLQTLAERRLSGAGRPR
jgi:hypothetical protein